MLLRHTFQICGVIRNKKKMELILSTTSEEDFHLKDEETPIPNEFSPNDFLVKVYGKTKKSFRLYATKVLYPYPDCDELRWSFLQKIS